MKLGTELEALRSIIDPIRDHDRSLLRKVATNLKQTDGESWAVGEMLERACLYLDALDVSVHQWLDEHTKLPVDQGERD